MCRVYVSLPGMPYLCVLRESREYCTGWVAAFALLAPEGTRLKVRGPRPCVVAEA